MNRIILDQLFKYTFIMYIKNLFKSKYNLNLSNVTEFWSKHQKILNKDEKVILVECMEELNLNWNTTYSFLPLLNKLYNTRVIALTSYKSYQETTNFLSYYHDIERIESVYKPFDFIVKIKSFLILLKNLPFVYNLEYGFKIIIDDINIGDLVYDEYLRIAKTETCRKPTFLFYIMTYNAIYQHLRYKKIIDKNNITDIVAIRDTYSHSSFYRAGSNLDNLTIWKNIMAPSSVIISKLKAYKDFNFKPQYFQYKHLKYIKDNYSENEIISIYKEIISVRTSGNVKNSIDTREMALAHSNHDIVTMEDFYKYYQVDKNKKMVIVYAHVFVDAVRYCHHTIFSDYYTWLTETLKFLVEEKNVNILVKPHPSELLYALGKTAEDVIIEFNKRYNTNIIFLEKKIDVKIIYELSDVIVTASGTIGVEAPCLGVKVITAGSTMYENTNAMFRGDTQDSYFKLLANFETLPNITEKQKMDSMIGFIWINKLIYTKSTLYASLDKEKSIDNQAKLLDMIYKEASLDDVKQLFERIQNNEFN